MRVFTAADVRFPHTKTIVMHTCSSASWSLFSVPVDVVTAPDVPDAPEPPKLGMAQAVSMDRT